MTIENEGCRIDAAVVELLQLVFPDISDVGTNEILQLGSQYEDHELGHEAELLLAEGKDLCMEEDSDDEYVIALRAVQHKTTTNKQTV